MNIRLTQKHNFTQRHIQLLFAGLLVLAVFFISTILANAAINKEINYQGKLTNSSGVTVSDGTYNMEFKLYTASSDRKSVV